jgi:hypothetical protein
LAYDSCVTSLWTALIGTVVLGVLGALLFAGTRPKAGRIVPAFLLGLAAGIVGAIFILGPRMDLVPDDVEWLAGTALVVLGSLGLVVAIWVRSTRH